MPFTYGGTLLKPSHTLHIESSRLLQEKKWGRFSKEPTYRKPTSLKIGDIFRIRRGLATGGNNFFILDEDRIKEFDLPIECFTPVLPSSRFVKGNEIFADESGNPILEKQLFLLNTRLSEEEISRRYPSLKSYLDMGKMGNKPICKGYLCRTRHPWYAQENRPHTPFICTYMGRVSKSGGPFRFILNHSRATVTNTYLLLYPQDSISRILNGNDALVYTIWEHLNMISEDELYSNGRIYGGGMQKLEPKELQNVDISSLYPVLKKYRQEDFARQYWTTTPPSNRP